MFFLLVLLTVMLPQSKITSMVELRHTEGEKGTKQGWEEHNVCGDRSQVLW